MNPQEQFCPNMTCPDKGKAGNGNIVSHSRQEQRYKCKTCGKTFSETKGTALYGLKKDSNLFVLVVTLLAFGCPTQAIVQAQLDLQQVQADEIKVRTPMGIVWMALAISEPSTTSAPAIIVCALSSGSPNADHSGWSERPLPEHP